MLAPADLGSQTVMTKWDECPEPVMMIFEVTRVVCCYKARSEKEEEEALTSSAVFPTQY